MNWYKISQNLQEYEQLLNQAQSIQITGTGQNEIIQLPGGSISAIDLLNSAKTKLAPILAEKGVHTIDTSPISDPQAQGLAVSHEPGLIHVDVQKIFNLAKQSLPPTSQFDGTQIDTDILQNLVQEISSHIEAELYETISHEGQHVGDFAQAYLSGQPFTSVQEAPAEQFGQQIRQRYF
jgi:hypothetical protein